MKKFIMLSAVMAAVSTAFIACSSDDDLAQAPAVPEETVIDTPKGTPFSLSVSADTRATMYNADAWGTSGANAVTMLKLYGKQPSYAAWMDRIFTRDADKTNWTSTRNATTGSTTTDAAAPCWPVDDPNTNDVESAEATKFYAITDNAIGTESGTPIAGISEWMSPTVGKFKYALPIFEPDPIKPEEAILWYNSNEYSQTQQIAYSYVNNSQLTDLMVASAETTEASTVNGEGKLSLAFTHALATLKIQAAFVSDAEYNDGNDPSQATIKSVMVCGLKGAGTYTFGGSPSPWATNTAVNYYYELPTPKPLTAEGEGGSYTPYELVPAGTFLVVPQSVTACATTYTGDYPTTGAYIAVRFRDSATNKDWIQFYPFTASFNAGKIRTITINIPDGYDPFDDTGDNGNAGAIYTAANTFVQ